MLLCIFIVFSFVTLQRRYTERKKATDIPIVLTLFIFIFLSKGPIALGILALPLCFILTPHRRKRIAVDTLWICSGACVLLTLAFTVEPSATSLHRWFDAQILGVLGGDRTHEYASNRWKIIFIIIEQLLIPAGACLLVFAIFRQRPRFFKEHLPLLFAALLFSLPFLVSLKQHDYYISPSLAFYVGYLLLLFRSNFDRLWIKLRAPWLSKLIIWVSVSICLFCTGYGISRYGMFSRDKVLLHDLQLIHAYTAMHSELGIANSIRYNWALHAYAMRHHRQSLLNEGSMLFLISDKSYEEGYERITIPSQHYHLHQLVPSASKSTRP